MTKASGSIDLSSIKKAYDDSSKVATNYLSFDSTNGLRVSQSTSDFTKPYVQVTNSGIKIIYSSTYFSELNSSGLKIHSGNATKPLASFGSSIIFYEPGTETQAATIDGTGINIKAGTIKLGSNFEVTSAGALTATGATVTTATIGNATNKITVGTGTSGHSSIRYGMTTLADTTNNGFYIGTDGIALGKGVFKVTADGTLYANGANITSIDGANITGSTIAVGAMTPGAQEQILNSNIKVGGRNLVWDTEWKDVANKWHEWGSPTTREIVTLNGKRWLHIVTTTTAFQGYEQNETYRAGDGEIQGGDKITVSYYAYAATAGQSATVGVHWRDSSNAIVGQNWTTNTLTTTVARYSATYTVPSNAVSFNVMVGDNTTTAQELWISQVQLEFGNMTTSWSPAPEDVAATATNYITTIGSNGIWVTPSDKKPTNTSTGAGATGTKIDGTGVGIYVGGTKLAQYGTTTYFYEPDGTTAATLDGTGLNIKTGTITLGTAFQVTSAGVLTATNAKLNNLTIYDSNGYKRAAATTSGFIMYDGASATTTTQIASFGTNGIEYKLGGKSVFSIFPPAARSTTVIEYLDFNEEVEPPYSSGDIVFKNSILKYNYGTFTGVKVEYLTEGNWITIGTTIPTYSASNPATWFYYSCTENTSDLGDYYDINVYVTADVDLYPSTGFIEPAAFFAKATDTSQIYLGTYADTETEELALAVGSSNHSNVRNVFKLYPDGTIVTSGKIIAQANTEITTNESIDLAIGSVWSASSQSTNTSVHTNWYNSGCKLKLPKGSYIITGSAEFDSNSSGRRALQIYNETGGNQLPGASVNQPASSNAATRMQVVWLAQPAKTITYRLRYASTVTHATINFRLRAIKII